MTPSQFIQSRRVEGGLIGVKVRIHKVVRHSLAYRMENYQVMKWRWFWPFWVKFGDEFQEEEDADFFARTNGGIIKEYVL